MATARAHARIAEDPEVVWALVSDPMAIVKWGMGMSAATWDADTDTRTITLDSGATVRERVVTTNNDLRRFQYEVLPDEGTGIERHLATADVLDDTEGSLLIWSVDVKPDAAGPFMQKMATRIIQTLTAYLEAQRAQGGDR
jgi:carbon monoxide dehydrogenase subunit G